MFLQKYSAPLCLYDFNNETHCSSVLGTVKIQHLNKFITMKYGLNSDNFVVDVIYKGDIIPQDYTLIDVAYYYKWEKSAPMQFYYRIFKKNKVLLKRRKRKSKSEDKISDGKKPRPIENSQNKNDSHQNNENKNNNNNNKSSSGKSNNTESAKNGNGEIMGCRTVSNGVNKSPPCLKKQDETGPKVKSEKKVGFKLDPPALDKDTNSKAKTKVKPEVNTKKRSNGPPILKPEIIGKIIAKKEPHAKINSLNNDDSSDEDDDKPSSEKKLKIDESVGNNVENQPTNIKIKVSANDVKKVEPKTVQSELTKVPKKEIVTPKVVNNHPTKKESSEIKAEKPTKIVQQQQDTKPKVNICIPKILPVSTSPSALKQKTSNTNSNLSNIVNNLAKKQLGASLNNTAAKNTSAANPTANKQTPPSSLLGGQTTITKKEVKNNQVNPVKNNVQSHHTDKNNGKLPVSLNSTATPKGLPKDTSITVRSVVASTSSPSQTSTSTAKVSFSNSLKSKNGSNSMMDLVQASNNPSAPASKCTSSPRSNGLISPSKQKSSTLSDLRQFRKDSGGSKAPQTMTPTVTTNSTPQRAPIIPALTPRNLTFGNSKNSKTNSPVSNAGSVPSSKSSPTSSFSAVLSKPLPKPGEASSATANNFLAQANNLSALAALGLGQSLGANLGAFTDEQQRQFLRNMAAVGMIPPMTGAWTGPTASVTQQLPSNRLNLKVTQAKNNSPVHHSPAHNPATSLNQAYQGMLPSLANHMSPESQWKMFSPLAAAAAASGNHVGGTNGLNNHHIHSNNSTSKYSSLSKNLNQSIRQIPNPSLLTKQASEQQQQLLQRAIASQVSAAAAVAAANARTSLSQ